MPCALGAWLLVVVGGWAVSGGGVCEAANRLSSNSELESPRRLSLAARYEDSSLSLYKEGSRGVRVALSVWKLGFWADASVSTGLKGARCLRGLLLMGQANCLDVA